MNNEPSTPAHTSNGLGLAALLLGIFALLTCLIPFIGLVIGIIAIVLGILGIKRGQGKGMAVAGLVMGSIGSLISLVVPLLIFLAVPSLQRNQQNIALKNDAVTAVSAITSYQTNHQGALPTPEDIKSSEFTQYTSNMDTPIISEGRARNDALLYKPHFDCSDTPSDRAFAISTILANGDTYCVDNS